MVAAAIIGGAVISAGATAWSADQAGDANRYGAGTAAQAQYDSTRLQVDEMRRQFDAQMDLLQPMIDAQYGAQQFFAEVLGFGSWNAESGEWEGGGPQGMGFGGPDGFMDPNLSGQQFGYDDAEDSPYMQLVRNSLLAGMTPDQDLAIQRANETALGTDYRNDPRFQFAQETGNIVGEDFQSSPGYEFAVEQMQREVDRKNSAGGGNYGGRALLEAQRRAKGLADQDYYSWVGARRQDLSRQDYALNTAVGDSRRREELNLARGDTALGDYFRRLQGDTGRLDAAFTRNQELGIDDRGRRDQSYYNYLNMLMGQANTGAVDRGVGSSASTAAGVAGAYGNQGNYLAQIWQNYGNNQGNIAIGEGQGYNNAFQGALSNWLFAQQAGLM